MYVTASESRVLARIFGLLSEDLAERDVREAVGHHLLELLEADYYASFVWQDEAGRFDKAVILNMDPKNVANYDSYYPVPRSHHLQAAGAPRRHPRHAGDAAARIDADRILQRFPRPRRAALGRQRLQLCRRPQYRRHANLAGAPPREFRCPYAGAVAPDRAGVHRRAGAGRRRSGADGRRAAVRRSSGFRCASWR